MGWLPILQPQYNGGRAQVNLGLPEPYNDFWALNAVKMMSGWTVAGTSETDWVARISDNLLPTSMPAGVGASWKSKQLYIFGINGATWDLELGPSDVVTFALNTPQFGTLTETVISSTKKRYTIGGSPTPTDTDGTDTWAVGCYLVTLEITAITTLTDLKLYRTGDASLFAGSDATAIFNPDFLNRAKQFGCLRFMDWARMNQSLNFVWADRTQEAHCIWSGYEVKKASWYYGSATKTTNKNRYTCPNSFGTLTHGQKIQFSMPSRPTKLTVSTMTASASPTTISFTGAHNLTTGDKITLDLDTYVSTTWGNALGAKNSATGLCPTFAVTVLNSTDVTIVLNSTGFGVNSGFRFHPVFEISDGTAIKQCYTPSLSHQFDSAWGLSYPIVMTAVYNATWDCMMFEGANQFLHMEVPFTAMIKLAQYCRSHPWICGNLLSNDSYWTNLATLVYGQLNGSGLFPIFEVDNELWNSGAQNKPDYAISEGSRLYGNGSGGQAYAKRVAEVSDLIKAVYGNGTDWKMALCYQALGTGSYQSPFEGNAAFNLGNSANFAINKCDIFGFAPYLTPVFAGGGLTTTNYPGYANAVDNYNQGNANLAFDWIAGEFQTPTTPGWASAAHPNENLDDYINTWTAGWVSNLTGYTGRKGTGVSLRHYEGGMQQVNPSKVNGGFPTTVNGRPITSAMARTMFTAFLASPQAGLLMRSFLTRSYNAGVRFPSQYTLAGIWTSTGNYGAYRLNDFTAAATPMYQTLLNWNNGN